MEDGDGVDRVDGYNLCNEGYEGGEEDEME